MSLVKGGFPSRRTKHSLATASTTAAEVAAISQILHRSAPFLWKGKGLCVNKHSNATQANPLYLFQGFTISLQCFAPVFYGRRSARYFVCRFRQILVCVELNYAHQPMRSPSLSMYVCVRTRCNMMPLC